MSLNMARSFSALSKLGFGGVKVTENSTQIVYSEPNTKDVRLVPG